MLKWAQSQDGFIGNHHHEVKITTAETDIVVHQWRAEEDAIMVGLQTVTIDNPQLNVRHVAGKQPLRITIDRNLELDAHFHLLNNLQDTLIFNHVLNAKEGLIEWIKTDTSNEIEMVLEKLHEKQVLSLMVEGGASLLNKFIKKDLWDEARIITSNKMLHDGVKAPLWQTPSKQHEQFIGTDKIEFYKKT